MSQYSPQLDDKTKAIYGTQVSNLINDLIVKCWRDPNFKAEFLANPKAKIQEALHKISPEYTLPADAQIEAVESTGTKFYIALPPDPNQWSSTSVADLTDHQLEDIVSGNYMLLDDCTCLLTTAYLTWC